MNSFHEDFVKPYYIGHSISNHRLVTKSMKVIIVAVNVHIVIILCFQCTLFGHLCCSNLSSSM